MGLANSAPRTTDIQLRHKSKKSENLGRCGRQNMLRPYLKIWEWEFFGHAVKAISSPGVCIPWKNSFMKLFRICRVIKTKDAPLQRVSPHWRLPSVLSFDINRGVDYHHLDMCRRMKWSPIIMYSLQAATFTYPYRHFK